jgi:hypothetical protein
MQRENAQIEDFFFHRVNDKNLCYVPELIFREYYLCVPYKLHIGLSQSLVYAYDSCYL